MTIKISFDAGHGKHTAGKRSPSGKMEEREWFFNDKILRYTLAYLKDYNVQTKRFDDLTGEKDISLSSRVNRINSFNPKAHFSFHNNAFQSKWGSHGGTEVYHSNNASQESKTLANLLQNPLVKALKTRNRGVKSANFYIITYTKVPAVLIEFLFMDSNDDIKKLRSNSYLKKAGETVAKQIVAHYKLKKKNSGNTSSNSKPSTSKPGKPSNKGKPNYNTKSIVTFLQSIKQPFSLNHRKKLAGYYNIKNYKGQASLNLQLLDLIKKDYKSKGKLRTSKPKTSSKPKPSKSNANLKVDGYMGKATISALQRYFGTPVDGVLSKPSLVIKELQKLLGVKADGYMGKITITAMQKRFKMKHIDGVISKPSLVIKELQRRLNKGKL